MFDTYKTFFLRKIVSTCTRWKIW